MRILRVIDSMDPANGGPCQGIRNSIPALYKLGVHNEVVCLDRPGSAFLENEAFPVHAIGPAKGPWAYSPRLEPWLRANFHRFDVVIAHGLWLFHSHAVRKALEKYKRRGKGPVPSFYIMPHGMLDPYFQRAAGRRLKAIRNWLYWKLVEGKVVNGSDGVLFTCQAELELARQPFSPYRPKKELNVGYGVPEPPPFSTDMRLAFQQACPGLKDRPYLLFLSRIHTKKGVDLLLAAYKTWLEDAGEGNVLPALVIAGPGLDSQFGQEMRQLVNGDVILQPNVFFTGMLTGMAKWGAFYNSEAFVLPSHQENFGIAVVEALACGKPVLTSHQVNIWKEIDSGGGGIFAPDSLEGVGQLLTAWRQLPAQAKRQMGCSAKEVYANFFAIEPAAKKLYATLKGL